MGSRLHTIQQYLGGYHQHEKTSMGVSWTHLEPHCDYIRQLESKSVCYIRPFIHRSRPVVRGGYGWLWGGWPSSDHLGALVNSSCNRTNIRIGILPLSLAKRGNPLQFRRTFTCPRPLGLGNVATDGDPAQWSKVFSSSSPRPIPDRACIGPGQTL